MPHRQQRLSLLYRFLVIIAANIIGRLDDPLAVLERVSGTMPLFSPTIRAALLGGCRWLDVYCPGCKTVATVDFAKVDRHPDTSLGSFVWWLKCRNCRGLPVPFPKLVRVWGNDWLRERLGLTAQE